MKHTFVVPTVELSQHNLEIVDLRDNEHPEFCRSGDLQNHIYHAFSSIGFIPKEELLDAFISVPEDFNRPSLLRKARILLADIRRVYFRKHSYETYSVGYSRNYTAFSGLNRQIPVRHSGKIALAKNAHTRVEMLQYVVSLTRTIPKAKVLEVGCGFGGNMLILKRLNPQLDVHGFEYFHARLASSIVNLIGTDMQANLFLADATTIKLHDSAFDVLYSNHVLEQLGQENAEKALKEMWRVARKGVVVAEPSLLGATLYEKSRVKRLGYCENLLEAAANLPDCRIVFNGQKKVRHWPNTDYLLVLERTI